MPTIDIHAHLEPRELDVAALLRKMDAAGVDKVALIPSMCDPLPHTPHVVLGAFRGLLNLGWQNVARRVDGMFRTREGDLKLQGKIIEIYPRPDNAMVAEAMVAHPDRFLGWIFVNPGLPGDAREEIERWRQQRGFVGVKLHPHWHDYPLERALPVAKRCEELDLPILVHLGFGAGGDWPVLTSQCPRLRILFAHAGIPHFGRMWSEVRANENLFMDLSSPYLSERHVRRAVDAVGPRSVLYGTDAPYGFLLADGSYDYAHTKGWVERLPISGREIDGILGGNVDLLLRSTPR